MAGQKQLPPVRIATDADVPSPPKSLSEAIESGTRLDELIALRLIISAHIQSENILARDLKSLSVELRDISREIENLSPSSEKDDLGKAADTGDEKFNPRAV
ncbi:hypothetical protein BLJ79_21555 [Arthrobacter sp. UCD-GKA]|uniref:hypothetical protein n=1 Tax=Arthrobacter sp. UCD-GKA TaxID=1913576 RepID=UPI0008DE086F|nr:hypothetical protein [Arthrobacter sp. UCD-GKA]OIH81947.1 hypothetical protein BLJ79_21555 [Arthrobacter sp. UCD-GKA]